MGGVDETREQIVRPEPLRAAVYRRVIKLMMGGELVPGQTVTEAGLSKSLGVSRTPVREALLQLEAEGVLESTPARGFTVRELSAKEAAELFPILAALEALAVRLGTSKPDLEWLRNLDGELSITKDPVERWRLDTAFHEKLIDRCKNESLRGLITRLRVTLSRYEIEYLRQAKNAVGNRHGAIIDALGAGDGEGADMAITENWDERLAAIRTWLSKTNAV
jgi:DNA-binding GntR family transcriptional regulator